LLEQDVQLLDLFVLGFKLRAHLGYGVVLPLDRISERVRQFRRHITIT
jgi:hypothetical protein